MLKISNSPMQDEGHIKWPSLHAELILSKRPAAPGGGLPRPDDSAFRVRWAEWNLVNGRAVGAPIFVDVTKGLFLCHIVVSLLMLGTPSGGGGAGVLLEGLGEGGLLRVA